MSCRLSELITQVRACKTAESERARITEECALIRNAIKDEGSGKRRPRIGGGASPFRERNMLKLMFAHMMGHSTHWAQMECVTMIASPHFHEKRVGYLGLALLLDESASVLTLVTHQLSRDLQDESPFVASLALSTIANIASADMARDLHRQVEKLLAAGAPLTRKKAALVCIRLFKVRDAARNGPRAWGQGSGEPAGRERRGGAAAAGGSDRLQARAGRAARPVPAAAAACEPEPAGVAGRPRSRPETWQLLPPPSL